MLKAGFSSVDITPALGTRTEIFQNLFVDKIVTPLLVKICVLDDCKTAAAIVTADVMDFFWDSIADVRAAVHRATGIPPDHVFVNSSHTHSAPYLYPSAQHMLDAHGTGFLDLSYYEAFLEAVFSAASDAWTGRRECVASHSRGIVDSVASNRRVELEDGSIGIRYGRDVPEDLRRRPDGLIDPNAECLWFHGEGGAPLGVLVNYACHGTSYNQYSEICWDYMGFARQAIEQAWGGQAMFLQGCAGNMSPGKYTTHEPLEDAMMLGRRLADAVLASFSRREPVTGDGITALSATVNLTGRTTLDRAELENRLSGEIAKAKEALAAGSTDPGGAMVISYLERLLMVQRHPNLSIPSEIATLSIGDARLVFLPGECFIQYALAIKERLSGQPVLVMAYSDCTLQYIPNAEAYEACGGYETDPDWCYSAKGNGEMLVEAAIRLLSASHEHRKN